jgi:hypothetical protein
MPGPPLISQGDAIVAEMHARQMSRGSKQWHSLVELSPAVLHADWHTMLMGRDRPVSSVFSSTGTGNDVFCLPAGVGSTTCSPCMFPGQDTGIPSQNMHTTRRSSMTHGCDFVPSCSFLPSRLGERAFPCMLSLPRSGREPFLSSFLSPAWGEGLLSHTSLPGKRERPWVTPRSALPGHEMVRHIPLQGCSVLASLGMERAMRPMLGPLAQSADSRKIKVKLGSIGR